MAEDKKLITEIEEQIKENTRTRFVNGLWAWTLIWIGVLASTFASLIVATDVQLLSDPKSSKVLLAAIAALPALAVTLERSFGFSRYMALYLKYTILLKEIRDMAKYQSLNDAELSKKYNELRIKMFDEWHPVSALALSEKAQEKPKP